MRTILAALAGAAITATLTTTFHRYWWPGFLHWAFSRGDQ